MKKYKSIIFAVLTCLMLSGCKCEYPEIFIYVRKLIFPAENVTDGRAVVVEGQMMNLKVTVEPWNATMQDIAYTSSDENIFTVDQLGIITGVGAGTAELTATAPDEKGVNAVCEVVVNPHVIPVQSINFLNITNNSITQPVGFILNRSDLSIEVLPEVATDKTYTLTIGDENIAAFDPDGNIIFSQVGETTLTATANGGSKVTATVSIIVTAP